MILTTETLQKYIGGQIEAQELNTGKVFRAEIKEISLEYQGRTLDIVCAWGVELHEDVWIDAHYCDAGYGLDLSRFAREDAEDGMVFAHTGEYQTGRCRRFVHTPRRDVSQMIRHPCYARGFCYV